MKALILVLVAVAASAVTSLFTSRSRAAEPQSAMEADDTRLRDSVSKLGAGLQALREEQARLAEAVRELELRPAAAPGSSRRSVDELDEAVARWMEAHAPELLAPHVGDEALAALEPNEEQRLETTPLEEIMAHLMSLDSMAFGDDDYWQELRDSGRIDEVLAEIEKLAAEDPSNPELQVALGGAYIQKLFEVGNSPAAGPLAMKADGAFDRALELDDTHWEARFTKAVSLSNWPAFLGKSGEAIRQFEILAAQQEQVAARPEHAQTYLFLGNMYQQTGEADKALRAWRDGLSRFPDSDELRQQVDTNSGR